MIKIHINTNNNVMRWFNGTIYFTKIIGLEKLSLSETFDFERSAAGWKDLDFEGVWKALL